MKRKLAVLVGLGVFMSALPALAQDAGKTEGKPADQAAKQGDKKPKLELSQTVWDFGQKWYGEPASTEIKLKNVGDAPLKIIQVRTSCGCTVAKPPKGTSWNGLMMQPGEELPLKLSYNTKKVRAKVSQTVTLTTNDPHNPTVQIQVKGGIKQLFQVAPTNRVTFAGLERNTEQTREVTLTSNVKEPVKLEIKGMSGNPPFEAKLEPIEEGKTYKLIVKTVPPLKLGSNATVITLSTDNERFPTMTIPVSAYVAPRVQASPMVLYVPRKGSTPIQRYIRVRYQTKTPIKITGIETTNDKVKAELMPPRTNISPRATIAMHEIRATLPPASEFPPEGAEIIIKTDDKDKEYQEFHVRVVLQPEPRSRANVRRKQITPAIKPAEVKPGAVKPDVKKADDKKPDAKKDESGG